MLAVILGDRRTTRDKVAQTLNTYEDIRMPIVTHVMQGSTMNGMRHQFNLGYEQGLEHLGQSIARQYDWLDENLPTQQVENALNQLHGI